MLSILNFLVSRNQSTFIPSRSISENVLLMKAYDSVNWNFIINCLSCFSFPMRFIIWVKECVSSPCFSISINGTLVGYFKGAKGLRQWDSLSPYLFVIAMEVFSKLKFHPRCSKLKLTHLCFVNDLLLFSNASIPSINVVKAVLLEFEKLSGLRANPSKSSFFSFFFFLSSRMKSLQLDDL
jgi:hypothetical protein